MEVKWRYMVQDVDLVPRAALAVNSVFSNSGIGVGFSMSVLFSFVCVWSGRKKGFLLKKVSQWSVKGSFTS